jgi:amino acid adenylation domain-containing protein
MYRETDEDVLLFDPVYLKQKEYWKEKLSGDIGEADIFVNELDSGFPGKQRHEKERLEISAGMSEKLGRLSKKSDLSIYILLLAVCKVFIYRYTGNKDVIVLSPLFRQKVTENTINNYLLIRTALDGRGTFKDLLINLRQSVLEAYNNQDYPFDKLLEFLRKIPGSAKYNKNPSHILCSMNNIHARENIAELTRKLSFSFSREADMIHGQLVYDANAVDTRQAQMTAKHFTRILEEMLNDVNARISDISYLSREERKQLITDFNDNRAFYFKDRSVHHLVERHAEAVPDRVAMVSEGCHLTYGELNKKARYLSVMLREIGVQKDKTVGILMDRGPLMLIAILATWKAGGAYIPLDPRYPGQRVIGILADAGSTALLTRPEYLDPEIRRDFPGAILEPKVQNHERKKTRDVPADGQTDMNGLSYVIYTSGSTGKPKGAMVEHIGMMNHICAKINDLRVTENTIAAQNSNHTFDISVWQFFTALVKGGKTVIYTNQQVLDTPQLVSRLTDDRVTILEVVPSYLAVMLDILNPHRDGLHLEFLLVTGEEVNANLVRSWFERYPGIKMVNAYGPTEASDDITHYIMDKAPESNRISIGKSLQNLDIYIVDNHGQLCPVGVKGEIWVSGVGVGRGYLNNPEMTAEKFDQDYHNDKEEDNRKFLGVQGPFFKKVPGRRRLYRTGDLGSWLPDGRIAFWGRKDYQLKVRGFRIEPGEIESQLLKHPDVNEAVVIDREDEQGDKYLCAYLVLNGNADIARVKESFDDSLPYYMIPAYFIPMEKLPLTSNGKVDRKALKHIEINTPAAADFQPPVNEMEEKLADIWSGVLGIGKDGISTNANFFDLGGQSLKATTLLAKIHKALNVKVPLTKIFKYPTIKELAGYLKGMAIDKFTAVGAAEEKEYYPLSSAQKRLYILQQSAPSSIFYNIPCLFELEGRFEKQRIKESFAKLVRRHENLRTGFHMVKGEPVQVIHNRVDFDIHYYESGQLNKEKFLEDFIRPFDLSRAPLLRIKVIKTAETEYLLAIDMHHIILDGVSIQIFIEDFMALYSGRELPGLRIHYKDFSQWQSSRMESEEMKAQEVYWLKEFEDEATALTFPTDFPRPRTKDFKGNRIIFIVDKEETAQLNMMAKEEGATLFILLLALMNVLFFKLSGQEDITLGTANAGRRHEDLERIMGMFVNTLALRNFPGRDKTFKDFLEEVKERTLKAFENQDYPFEAIVEKAVVKKDPGRHPLFDVGFAMQNMDTQEIEIPGLKLKPYDYDYKMSKFDMSTIAIEHGDQLLLSTEYSTKLFKKESVERFMKHLKEVITAVISNRDIRLKDIRLAHSLSNAEANIPDIDFGI